MKGSCIAARVEVEMRFVIVTGMSGAGKSTALKMLEDVGYFCVDNLPLLLIRKFAELTYKQSIDVNNIALGVDIRSGQALSELEHVLEDLVAGGFQYEILFLDASDSVLVKRYKETRRNHPLAGEGRVDQGILEERKKLNFLKKQADYIIDTSQLLTRELKSELDKIFVKNEGFNNLFITVLSFGFKYGIPSDADLVFDVRFLPNPYYIEDLRPKTGNEKEIQDYVMGFEVAGEFLNKLEDMIRFLIPNYIAEGKNQLVIAIGCTGGKHRSVTLANRLSERLTLNKEYGLKVEHRDIQKDSIRKSI
jgi:RNase adapter protein RapZ